LARTVLGAYWTEIDEDGVAFLTDVNGTFSGNVSQSFHEALEAALSWTIQGVAFFLSLGKENVFYHS
jgi:hypothetical protein